MGARCCDRKNAIHAALFPARTGRETPEASLTLLDLVAAVNEVTRSDEEAVAVIGSLLESRRIRLVGNFRRCHLAGVAAA